MRMILAATLAIVPLLAKDNEGVKRLNEAATVFSEVMATPDKGIPQDMLENAHCIVIVPSLKTAAFLVGGKFGKGYVSCRNKGGTGWSAPGTVRIEGGSVGFQSRCQVRQRKQIYEIVCPALLRILLVLKDDAGRLDMDHDASLQPALDGVAGEVIGAAPPAAA